MAAYGYIVFLLHSRKIPYKYLEQMRFLVQCEPSPCFPVAYEFLHQPVECRDFVHEWVDGYMFLNQVFSDDGFHKSPHNLLHPLIKMFDFK